MDAIVLLIIINIISVIIGLYLALFKSYFQEKGKNLATNEDIEELTEKVESVKQNFIEKNAVLKARLDILTSLELNHKHDERAGLIAFHRALKNWIRLLTESTPSLIDDYDNNEVHAKIYQYEMSYQKVLDCEALLELYIVDKEFIQSIYDLKSCILNNLMSNPVQCLIKIKENNLKVQLFRNSPPPLNEEDEIMKKEELAILLDERQELYHDYRSKMVEGYSKVIKVENIYREFMRKYILSISE